VDEKKGRPKGSEPTFAYMTCSRSTTKGPSNHALEGTMRLLSGKGVRGWGKKRKKKGYTEGAGNCKWIRETNG